MQKGTKAPKAHVTPRSDLEREEDQKVTLPSTQPRPGHAETPEGPKNNKDQRPRGPQQDKGQKSMEMTQDPSRAERLVKARRPSGMKAQMPKRLKHCKAFKGSKNLGPRAPRLPKRQDNSMVQRPSIA